MNHLEGYEKFLREVYRPKPWKGVQKERLEESSIANYLNFLKWISEDIVGAPVRGGVLNNSQDFFKLENFDEINSLVFRLEARPKFMARSKKEKSLMITVFYNYLDYFLYLRKRK